MRLDVWSGSLAAPLRGKAEHGGGVCSTATTMATMTAVCNPCPVERPTVGLVWREQNEWTIYPHTDPDEVHSPEIRRQLSRTALPAPRSHTALSLGPPSQNASRPADVYCPRNINLILDIVLDQKAAPPLSPFAFCSQRHRAF